MICLHESTTSDDDLSWHRKCLELKYSKHLIDDAIEQGSKQKCKKCGLAGVKDNACTHMVCEVCAELWCYICGQSEEDCDGDEGTLSSHNIDWQTNSKRCPMYFNNIHEVDNRWPDDDSDCLEYFHRYRTLSLLHNVYEQLGEYAIEELNEHFHSIDSCGYSMSEIKEFENSVLIDYENQHLKPNDDNY
ncbi:unnamed protein product [Didymodactylos carnosus]|nr:unnamed protein product [Didymodactylos carnosus]CAF4389467.1 unnamed protein product [Didymodactylos carnosus]